MIRLRNLRDRLAARLLVALDADCGPVADDDGIEPDPPRQWVDLSQREQRRVARAIRNYGRHHSTEIHWADDDDQDES